MPPLDTWCKIDQGIQSKNVHIRIDENEQVYYNLLYRYENLWFQKRRIMYEETRYIASGAGYGI